MVLGYNNIVDRSDQDKYANNFVECGFIRVIILAGKFNLMI